MPAPHLVLHHFPGACSSVTVCALEMAGLAYDLALVDLSRGEQGSEEYRAMSPLGKVPLLLADGRPLSENVAIVLFIAGLRPGAGILPATAAVDPSGLAEAVGGMAFCAATLHPIVRGLLNPQRLTTGEPAPVRERAHELALRSFAYADERLAATGWWLGERSIVDVYLDWAFAAACKAGLADAQFPHLSGLPSRLSAMPAYTAMQRIDAEARLRLGL